MEIISLIFGITSGLAILFDILNLLHCLVLPLELIFALSSLGSSSEKNRQTPIEQAPNAYSIPSGYLEYIYRTRLYRGYRIKPEIITIGKFRPTYGTRLTLYASQKKEKDWPQPKNVNSVNQPVPLAEVKTLLTFEGLCKTLPGKFYTTPEGQVIWYEQNIRVDNVTDLHILYDLLIHLAEIYPALVALGGEIIPLLQQIVRQYPNLEPLVTQLLKDIAQDTTARLQSQIAKLLCPNCLVHYQAQKISLGWRPSLTFCGCRSCKQSRIFLENPGRVIAKLDRGMKTRYTQVSGGLQVNYFALRTLFDFDKVEIINASDEDVERFAVQVGNDTDKVRRSRYSNMACFVSPACHLSENTMRILDKIFKEVVVRYQ